MKRSSTIANKVYKFVHTNDEWIMTNLIGYKFENQWLRMKEDGAIIAKGSNLDGYTWDACSPKWHFIHLTWGTPDGKLDYDTEKPITYYASMFHDIIYQFKDERSQNLLGQTVLHIRAATSGQLETHLIKKLLELGADDNQGKTAIQVTKDNNNDKAIATLLE